MAIQIHPTALVDKNAQLGEDVEIGPYASVGPDVKIGARTVVQQGASVIPENDPTVLFTTAGLHPLVPYLM